MTHTTREEHVRGAIGGVVIALAAVIAIFAFASLTEAQTPSTNIGTTTVNNGADAAIGANGILNTRQTCSADGQCYPYTAPIESGANTQFTGGGVLGATTTATTTGTGTIAGTTTNTTGTDTGADTTIAPSALTPSAGTQTLGTTGGNGSAQGAFALPAPLITAEPSTAPMPMIVDIDRDGTALVRGVVQSVGTTSLSIGSWGGTWTIRIAPDSVVTPSRLAGFMPGDFVGAFGVVSAAEAFTINASVVRNWTTAPPAGVTRPTTVSGTGTTPSLQSSPAGTGGAAGANATGTPAGGQTMTSTPATNQSGTTTGGTGAGTTTNGSLLPF